MLFHPSLSFLQQSWLAENGYSGVSFIAKGKSGAVFLVSKNAHNFAVKVEHEKSTRFKMLEKEFQLLKMVNELGIGPKVVEFNTENGILIMEFIEGIPLGKWVKENKTKENNEKRKQKILEELFLQAKKLDDAGIDHGQLGGKLHNILVDKKDRVFIIDFEKASYVRGVHNVSKLNAIFNPEMKNNTILKNNLPALNTR